MFAILLTVDTYVVLCTKWKRVITVLTGNLENFMNSNYGLNNMM